MAELGGPAGGEREGGEQGLRGSMCVRLSVRPTTIPRFNWRDGTGPDSRIPRPETDPDSRIPKTGIDPDWERAARQGGAGGQGAGPGRAGQGGRGAGGRGQGRAGRGAGAPTGDFTVAFGHGHPLVWNYVSCFVYYLPTNHAVASLTYLLMIYMQD